jgi:2-dehydropantoate 2-reductase
MRQIPRYCLIGSGRLACHFSHYFSLLNISYNSWSRQDDAHLLDKLVKNSDIILLLISDDAIASFIHENEILLTKKLVHCSGSLVLENVIGIHPLMSFGVNLYDFDIYKQISFVIDDHIDEFYEIFPNLPNKCYHIDKSQKAFYHALCVMSGNFTSILWAKLFDDFESKLNIPKESAFPYLKIIMQNLMEDHNKALTGPISRGDKNTMARNMQALENDKFKYIYQDFIKLYNRD